MKEAFGGIFNIFYLMIFLVIVIGVLGLTFSYTKAFKMKNAIISVIEEYEGSGCYPEMDDDSVSDSACRQEILRRAQDLKYNPVSLNCTGDCSENGGLCKAADLYCYEMRTVHKDNKKYATFRVVTQVDINFPIVEKIMGMSFFQVAGDTKQIQIQK